MTALALLRSRDLWSQTLRPAMLAIVNEFDVTAGGCAGERNLRNLRFMFGYQSHIDGHYLFPLLRTTPYNTKTDAACGFLILIYRSWIILNLA